MAIKSALIVGGGIGGMTAALALTRLGVWVDLIDADPEWRVYGAGLSLTGISLRAFEALGILEDLKARGFVAKGMRVMDSQGNVLMSAPVSENPKTVEQSGGIMRPVLHDILANRVREANINVTLGVKVARLEQDDDGVDVAFTDDRIGRYDLVVGADGIYSTTRDLIFPDAPKPKFTGQGAWRVVADRPTETDRLEIYGGPFKIGVNPVSQDRMYLFLLENLPDNPHFAQDEYVPHLKQVLAPYGGHIADIRDGLVDPMLVNYRPLEWLLLPDPWYNGRVVLIGDAAHATTPHLASGAGIAAEDALVLAEEVARHDHVAEALDAFMKRRFERAKMVVERSVNIGEIDMAGDIDRSNMMVAESFHFLAAPY